VTHVVRVIPRTEVDTAAQAADSPEWLGSPTSQISEPYVAFWLWRAVHFRMLIATRPTWWVSPINNVSNDYEGGSWFGLVDVLVCKHRFCKRPFA